MKLNYLVLRDLCQHGNSSVFSYKTRTTTQTGVSSPKKGLTALCSAQVRPSLPFHIGSGAPTTRKMVTRPGEENHDGCGLQPKPCEESLRETGCSAFQHPSPQIHGRRMRYNAQIKTANSVTEDSQSLEQGPREAVESLSTDM